MADIFVANTKKKSDKPGDAKRSKDTASTDIMSQAKKIADPIINFKNPVHIFASYAAKPGDVTFEHQDPGEEVLLFARQDFITNVPWIAITILLIFIPLIVNSFLPIRGVLSFLPSMYTFFIALLYYLVVATYVYVNFITWFFNISLVTNIRVMDLDFSDLVYKSVSSTKIDLIQDVSFTQVGVLRTIFDYGDVLIQTAGAMDNFIFERVPRPDDIVDVIDDLIGKGKGV